MIAEAKFMNPQEPGVPPISCEGRWNASGDGMRAIERKEAEAELSNWKKGSMIISF